MACGFSATELVAVLIKTDTIPRMTTAGRFPSSDISVEAFAEAVAGAPDFQVLPIAADNSSSGWVSRDVFNFQGAFAVRPRADLVAVDFDLTGNTQADSRRRAACMHLFEVAQTAGAGAVLVQSGRPGHLHVFVRCYDASAATSVRDWAASQKLDVREQGIRPPAVPHRGGRFLSTVLGDARSALSALVSKPTPEADVHLLRSLGRPLLSARMRRTLKEGHEFGGYPSNSEARLGLALALRAGNSSVGLLRRLLDDPSNQVGQSWRSKDGRWQARELERLWDKAGQYLGGQENNVPYEGVEKFWLELDTIRWSGLGGNTDLAVAEALAGLALSRGGTRFIASVPEIAIEAGVHTATARRSLRRLASRGVVSVWAKPGPTWATTWQLGTDFGDDLTDQAEHQQTAVSARHVSPRSLGDQDLACDAGRHGAFGKIAVRVFRALDGSVLTAGEISSLCGIPVVTVRRKLRCLAEAGLVRRGSGNGWSLSRSRDTTSHVLDGSGGSRVRTRRGARMRQLLSYRAEKLARAKWLEEQRTAYTATAHPPSRT